MKYIYLFTFLALTAVHAAHLYDEIGDNRSMLNQLCHTECGKVFNYAVGLNATCHNLCLFVDDLIDDYGLQVNKLLSVFANACDQNYQLAYVWAMDDTILWAYNNNGLTSESALEVFYFNKLLDWGNLFLEIEADTLRIPAMNIHYPNERVRDDASAVPVQCGNVRRLPGSDDLRLSFDITTETKRLPVFAEMPLSDKIFRLPHSNKTSAVPIGVTAKMENNLQSSYKWSNTFSFDEFARRRAINMGLDYQNGMFSISQNGVKEAFERATVHIESLHVSAMDLLYSVYNDELQSRRLHPNFVAAIQKLPSSYSTDTAKQKYYNFFARYGTHFFESLSMGGKVELLLTFNENTNSKSVDVDNALNFLDRLISGSYKRSELAFFFDPEILSTGTVNIYGGPLALPPTPLKFLFDKDIQDFKNMLLDFPAIVDMELKPLTILMKWTRPSIAPFLEQAFADYLNRRMNEVTGDEIQLHASKFSFVYCPEYFAFENAVDTGSGLRHGIFPPTHYERASCECCLATEGMKNDGEAECTLYCKRTSAPDQMIPPRTAVQSSVISTEVCFNQTLFNETAGSKYALTCIDESKVGVTLQCQLSGIIESNLFGNALIPQPRGKMSASKETWTIVGIVIAAAFGVTIIVILLIMAVLRYKSVRPRSATYHKVPTTGESRTETS